MAHDTEWGVKYEPKDYATGINYPEHIINYYRRVVATYDATQRKRGLQRVDQLGEDGGNMQNNRNDEPEQGMGPSYPRSAAGEPEEGGCDIPAGHAGQGETVAAQPAGDAQAAVLAEGREGQTGGVRLTLARAVQMVLRECAKAEAKHGLMPKDLTRQFMIMSEEYGEWAKEVVKLDRKPEPEADASIRNLMKEEVQAAAVALRAIETLLG